MLTPVSVSTIIGETMAKNETTKTIPTEPSRNISVVLPAELHRKLFDESFELRQRSLSGAVRVILEQYFDSKEKK